MEKQLSFPLPARIVATIVYGRTVANLPFRIVYPFLPAIARGLGISLDMAGRLASIQGAVGLFALLFGHLSDHHGRRRIMEVGLLLLALSALLLIASNDYLVALLAFAGFGLGKALYDPAMLAYVGDAIPYVQRARAIAITELAWSFAWFFGVPLSGFLITYGGWLGPWWALILLALLAATATHLLLPPARRTEQAESPHDSTAWTTLLRRTPVRAGLLAGFGLIIAMENVLIVYGAFLENRFGLAISTLGLASMVIGLAEMLAELGAATWTDRLGKKRSVLLGLLLFAGSLLLLPFLGGHLATVLGGFAATILFFEFTFVSLVPIMSELVPEARATLLSMNIAALGLGRTLAPLIGTSLYQQTGNLLANCLLSVFICLLSAWAVGRWVQENEEQSSRVMDLVK